MRLATPRACLALAVKKNREMLGADVATAYLNSEFEEELYLRFGCGCPIYRLRQAGRAWAARLEKSLKKQGFRHLRTGPGAFISTANSGSEPTLILTWEDDPIVFARGRKRLRHMKLELFIKLKITAGPLMSLLGLCVVIRNGSVSIDQEAYIHELAAK